MLHQDIHIAGCQQMTDIQPQRQQRHRPQHLGSHAPAAPTQPQHKPRRRQHKKQCGGRPHAPVIPAGIAEQRLEKVAIGCRDARQHRRRPQTKQLRQAVASVGQSVARDRQRNFERHEIQCRAQRQRR